PRAGRCRARRWPRRPPAGSPTRTGSRSPRAPAPPPPPPRGRCRRPGRASPCTGGSRDLLAGTRAAGAVAGSLPRLALEDAQHLLRGAGPLQDLHLFVTDLAPPHHLVLDPRDEAVPVIVLSDQDDGEGLHLLRLDQRHRLEHLVQRAEP